MSDNNTFGGFSALGSLMSDPIDTHIVDDPSDVTDPTPDDGFGDSEVIPADDFEGVDPSDIENPEDDDTPPIDSNLPPKDTDIPPVETGDDGEPSNDEPSDISDLGEDEPLIAQYIQEKLFSSYGWEVEEDKKFNSVEDLVKFIDKTVEENSTPRYANDQIKELNDYVNNGGNLKTYFDSIYGNNSSDIDIATKSGQDKALREFFKLQGLSDNTINSKIQRYEDTGVLKDEASEAYEYLEKYKQLNNNKLLEEQKRIKETNDIAQQEFFDSVESAINELKNVRGIPVSAQERQELLEYIFKPTATGKTQYQQEYQSSINNLIESAFFTKKGDALVKKLNMQASSNAAKALKNKLQTKTKIKGGSPDMNTGTGKFAFSSLGRAMGQPSFIN